MSLTFYNLRRYRAKKNEEFEKKVNENVIAEKPEAPKKKKKVSAKQNKE